MKRLIFALLALAMVLALCACGAAPAEPTASPAPAGTPQPAIATAGPDGTPVPAPETTPTPTAEPMPEYTPAPTPEATETPAETAPPAAVVITTPAPSQAPEPAPEPTPEPTPAAEPYSVQTADTVLTVRGDALAREWYFTLAELQSAGGYTAADYFSRGKDPQEATNSFEGIDLQYLLETVVGVSDYKKITVRASDGYAYGCSRSSVNMAYINEQVEGSALKMILAWSEDGAPITLRLVMGQMTAGEYNRTNFVRSVTEIEVKAG